MRLFRKQERISGVSGIISADEGIFVCYRHCYEHEGGYYKMLIELGLLTVCVWKAAVL